MGYTSRALIPPMDEEMSFPRRSAAHQAEDSIVVGARFTTTVSIAGRHVEVAVRSLNHTAKPSVSVFDQHVSLEHIHRLTRPKNNS